MIFNSISDFGHDIIFIIFICANCVNNPYINKDYPIIKVIYFTLNFLNFFKLIFSYYAHLFIL